MEFLLILRHIRRQMHSVIKNSHHLPWLCHICLRLIATKQVLRDVLKVFLEYSPPLVSKSELFETSLVECAQINCPGSHAGLDSLSQMLLLKLVSCRDRLQVGCEDLLVAEEEVRELLQGQVRVVVGLDGASVQRCCLVQR